MARDYNKEITIATVAMNVVYDKQKNLNKMLHYIDEAANKGANLIVFPEACLQGYLYSLNHSITAEEFEYHFKNAEPIDGPSTMRIIDKAKQRNITVIFGMIEDAEVGGNTVLYNCSVAVGPEGVIGVYRKVHQPGDELHIFNDGIDWPVFDTEVGKIGMLICYDKIFPESGRELALRGAELLIMPTAWPLMSNKEEDLETDHSGYLYNLFDFTRAAENQTFFISSNQVGVCELTGRVFYGHSRIVSPFGKTIAEIGYEEGMAVATINVQQTLLRTRTYDLFTHNLIKDRKPHTYKHLSDSDMYYNQKGIQRASEKLKNTSHS